MTMKMSGEVVKQPFTKRNPQNYVCDRTVIFVDFALEEVEVANSILKLKNAPGPDNMCVF